MKTTKVELTIKKGDKGLWGSFKYNNNLIVDNANDLAELESKLKTAYKNSKTLTLKL